MYFMHTQRMQSVSDPTKRGGTQGVRQAKLREILEAAATVAARQHGAITRRQLVECGWGERQIERRVREGRLENVARGVYVISGTPPTWERRVVCAYLFSAGRARAAVVSHETAGAVFGFAKCHRGLPIVLTARAQDRHPHPLAVLSRVNDLLEEDVIIGPIGVPMTSPARTVLDLATRTTRVHVIEAIITDAIERGVVTVDELQARVAKSTHRAGIVTVRRVLRRVKRAELRRIRYEQRRAAVLERRALAAAQRARLKDERELLVA